MSLLIPSEPAALISDSAFKKVEDYQFPDSVSQQIFQTPPSFISRRNYLRGDPKFFWLIRKGFVRTFTYTENVNTVTLGIWGRGDIISPSLSSVPNYFIEAMTAVEAIPIYTQNWQPPTELILKYWQQTERLLLARAEMSVSLILMNILNWLSKRFGQLDDKGLLIDLNLTHQDLSELCGTSRVTVTRLLKKFEEDGLILRDSRKITLVSTTKPWHYEI